MKHPDSHGSFQGEIQKTGPEILRTAEIHIEQGALVLLIGAPASGKSTFANKHFPVESIVKGSGLYMILLP